MSVVVLIGLFFMPFGQALAEPVAHESSCPIAKVVLSGNWEKLKPGLVENDRGMRYLETRRSADQQLAGC